MIETFKYVPKTHHLYMISNLGTIKSMPRIMRKGHLRGEVIIKPKNNGKGYLFVALCIDGVISCKYVHRLVAELFLGNPELKATVNHKDGDRSNNQVDNLEWNTYSENNTHSYQILKRRTNGKPVLLLNNDFSIQNEFKSCCEAARELKVHQPSLAHIIKKNKVVNSVHLLNTLSGLLLVDKQNFISR